MAEVFISYARKDKGFVRDIHAALQKVNRDTWIDWRSIPESAKWRAEIFAAIEAADNFLFIISPDSVKSWMCGQEVSHAVANNKRLITILYRSVEHKELLPALAEIQWIDYPRLGFEQTFERLITAIDTDLDWVRKHTRFLVRATEWESKGRDQGYVLHGTELKEAVRWLEQAAAIKGSKPTELQERYIGAGEEWKWATGVTDTLKIGRSELLAALGGVESKTAEIAVRKLHIDHFIAIRWDIIEGRFLDAESRVTDMRPRDNMSLVAELLQITAQILRNCRENFREAIEWVRDSDWRPFREADPLYVLLALTLLYLVGKGLSEAAPEKLDKWRIIQYRVNDYMGFPQLPLHLKEVPPTP